MIPSKSKLQTKLAYNSTKLKSLRANVSNNLYQMTSFEKKCSGSASSSHEKLPG